MSTKEFFLRDKNNNDYSQNKRKKSTDFYFSENILLKDLIRNEYYNSSNSISYKFIKRCYEVTFYYIISADLCGNETISLTKKDYKTDKENNGESLYNPIEEIINIKKEPVSEFFFYKHSSDKEMPAFSGMTIVEQSSTIAYSLLISSRAFRRGKLRACR